MGGGAASLSPSPHAREARSAASASSQFISRWVKGTCAAASMPDRPSSITAASMAIAVAHPKSCWPMVLAHFGRAQDEAREDRPIEDLVKRRRFAIRPGQGGRRCRAFDRGSGESSAILRFAAAVGVAEFHLRD